MAYAVKDPCDDIGLDVTLGTAFLVASCGALPNTRRRFIRFTHHRHGQEQWLGKDATNICRMKFFGLFGCDRRLPEVMKEGLGVVDLQVITVTISILVMDRTVMGDEGSGVSEMDLALGVGEGVGLVSVG